MKVMKLLYRRLNSQGHQYAQEEAPREFPASVILNRRFVREHLRGVNPKDTELVLVVGRRDEEPPVKS